MKTNVKTVIRKEVILVQRKNRFIFSIFNELKKEQKAIYDGSIIEKPKYTTLNKVSVNFFKDIEKSFFFSPVDLLGVATPEQLVKWFKNGGQFTHLEVLNLCYKFQELQSNEARQRASEIGTDVNHAYNIVRKGGTIIEAMNYLLNDIETDLIKKAFLSGSESIVNAVLLIEPYKVFEAKIELSEKQLDKIEKYSNTDFLTIVRNAKPGVALAEIKRKIKAQKEANYTSVAKALCAMNGGNLKESSKKAG